MDLATGALVTWQDESGDTMQSSALAESPLCTPQLEAAVLATRARLLEALAECDDEFADAYLEALDGDDDDAAEPTAQGLGQGEGELCCNLVSIVAGVVTGAVV